MIVDDRFDPDLQEFHGETICRVLKKEGHDARSFVSGNAALNVYPIFVPQLIITDAKFQDDVTAWDFAFSILRPNYVKKPCYLAGLHTVRDRRAKALCEEFGFDEVLYKPVTESVFHNWVKKAAELAGNEIDLPS